MSRTDLESAFYDFSTAAPEASAADLAARVLTFPAAREFALARRDSAEARPHVLRLARHDVLRAARAGADWTGRAVRWMVDLDATWEESAEFFSKLCRRARDVRNVAGPYLRPAEFLRSDLRSVPGRSWLHLYLVSLRYEFRCAVIEHAVETLAVPIGRLDPYSHALYAFGLLGQNKPEAVTALDEVIARAPDNHSVLHLLSDALRFAEAVPDHAERMLELLDHPVLARTPDTTILFRQAFALRRLGRYDQALALVDRSLALLGPNEVDRYNRRMSERYRILEERHLTRRITEEVAAAERVAQSEIERIGEETTRRLFDEVGQVRRQVNDNLFRIVEILGIFTAVIALVIGGVASVATAGLAWWHRAVLLAVFGAVALGLFAGLRLVVWYEPGARRGARAAPPPVPR